MSLIPIPQPKTRVGAGINALTALALIINAVVFNIWRGSNPPANPGGPLGGMGLGVALWEFTFTMSPFICVPCAVNVFRYYRRRQGAVHSAKP